MHKGRLEAFSDAVLAIVITILVLELKIPHSPEWSALIPLVPAFVSHVLSFIYLGIYWNNHHHLLQAAGRVSGAALWANLYLLFWLSLIPFVTGWMGENEFATVPVAVYGFDLLMAALAYYLLERALIAAQGPESRLKMAIGAELKGWVSIGFCCRNSGSRVLDTVGLAWFLRAGVVDVDYSRPPHRAGAGRAMRASEAVV
jgi:uncharacterized membrane protein